MKIIIFLTENCHFLSSEKSQYITWPCFRNAILTPIIITISISKVDNIKHDCLSAIKSSFELELSEDLTIAPAIRAEKEISNCNWRH